ncbi:DUF3892 domain-containing protein [Mesoplasma seiffertii]|uniref:DUF3892 domain-containing protein n=1 Tax=Mesoplasma seiffertii TaxID=28224 RepID=UPI00047C8FD8|nr:DUF3892 domain-containing protein [Mesoplasma seiffertii]
MNKINANKKMFKVEKETSTGTDLIWKNKDGETLTRSQAMRTSKADLSKLGLEKVTGSKNQASYIRSKADSTKKNNLDYTKK